MTKERLSMGELSEVELEALKEAEDEERGDQEPEAEAEQAGAEAKAAAEETAAAAEEAAVVAVKVEPETEKTEKVGKVEKVDNAATEAAAKTTADKAAVEAAAAAKAAAEAETSSDQAGPLPTILPSAFDFGKADTTVKDLDVKITANREAAKKLRADLDTGEIDLTEYHDKIEGLNDERMGLISSKASVTTAREMAERTDEANWKAAQDAFWARKENAVLNANDVLYGALSQQVIDISTKNPRLAYTDILMQARERVMKAFNMPALSAAKPGDATAVEAKRKELAAAAAKQQKKAPLTLGDLPAEEEVGGLTTADPEFEAIDKMFEAGRWHEAESRLARLSPERANAYLQQDTTH